MASKVPEIRFAGFGGEWDNLPLSEYLTTSKAKNRDSRFGKEDVLSVSREYGVINQIAYQGRSFAGASVTGYGVVETDDIVYTKSPLRDQPHGIIKTNKGIPGIVSALYAIYHPNENVEPEFIQTFFDKDKRLNDYLRPIVHKGAKNTLNIGDEEALQGNVRFPKRTEQIKISESFRNIDDLISRQKFECEKLHKLKSALLTSLFPQGKETHPRIRLNNFRGDWEEKQLSEILSSYREVVGTPHDGYERLGIRSHGKGTFHSYVPKGAELETAQMSVVRANNLIVNITFGWELAVAITESQDEGKLVSHRFPQFSFNEGYVPLFYRYSLINNRFRKHLTLASPGSAGRNRVLKIDKMLEYKVLVPSQEEQKAIADLLNEYDRLIQLNEQKLEKLRNLKQAMLDKMFV